jgi:hypothetical protein
MSKDKEIRDLFSRHNVPLDRDDVWAVQGTPVVKHKAVERLGAALNIVWDHPKVVLAERDAVAILVEGSIGDDHYEWSIGEAVVQPMRDTGRKNDKGKPIYEAEGIGNYAITPKQAAYPYAMAEKRGKDRVILKLAGLQGVYSEEEADDFKSRDPEPSNAGERALPPATKDSRSIYVENSLERIAGFQTVEELAEWLNTEGEMVWPDFGITQHDPDGSRIIMACKARKLALKPRAAA